MLFRPQDFLKFIAKERDEKTYTQKPQSLQKPGLQTVMCPHYTHQQHCNMSDLRLIKHILYFPHKNNLKSPKIIIDDSLLN